MSIGGPNSIGEMLIAVAESGSMIGKGAWLENGVKSMRPSCNLSSNDRMARASRWSTRLHRSGRYVEQPRDLADVVFLNAREDDDETEFLRKRIDCVPELHRTFARGRLFRGAAAFARCALRRAWETVRHDSTVPGHPP